MDTKTELKRLEELKRYNILHTPPEPEYDDIVKLASKICDAPISLISLIDKDTQSFKANLGLYPVITRREDAFCSHTILQDDIMIVEDAKNDHRFKNNPFVVDDPNIRFYAGVPLTTPKGYNLGSLCVIDKKPRDLNELQIESLKVLGRQVINLMTLKVFNDNLKDANNDIMTITEELLKINDTNNKLLSIIAHDIKSPLASVSTTLEMLLNGDLSQEELMEMSSGLKERVNSTSIFLDNLLNWATSQFNSDENKYTKFNLFDSVQRVATNWGYMFKSKNNTVINSVDKNTELNFDNNVIKFVVRNVLLNANKFTENGKIEVSYNSENRELKIKDSGCGMDKKTAENLFNWDFRESKTGTKGETGSGLGLKVCYDMLKKNDADIKVVSEAGVGSEFIITLPKKVQS
ncbi:MAG TPA: GAF domain-containing sensor histidine kinase [Ignavibacteria bacterium]|nr:GAF domain-containing sensor histidine kinase [Ignavibacteria bacterium]